MILSVTWPRCGAARNVCERLTEDTKHNDQCHRSDGWVPAETLPALDSNSEGLGIPSTQRGTQGTPYFILSLLLHQRGSENQVLTHNTLLQTWAQGILLCSRGAVGCSMCYSVSRDGLRRYHHWVKVLPGTSTLPLQTISIPLCKLSVLITKSYPHAKSISFE